MRTPVTYTELATAFDQQRRELVELRHALRDVIKFALATEQLRTLHAKYRGQIELGITMQEKSERWPADLFRAHSDAYGLLDTVKEIILKWNPERRLAATEKHLANAELLALLLEASEPKAQS